MRIFFVVADVGGLGRQWWMARQGSAFVDAIECCEEVVGFEVESIDVECESSNNW